MGSYSSLDMHRRKASQLTEIAGVIGYIVKLVHIPVNNILVGGS
jgi:hypothetical protein